MELKNIVISKTFKKTTPRREKIDRAKEYYLKNGELKKKIVINSDGELVDGYARYLALCELGIRNTPIVVRRTKYVYGYNCEDPNRKEYVWKLVGDDVQVGTIAKAYCWDKKKFKNKLKKIVVTKVTYNEPDCRTKLKDCFK